MKILERLAKIRKSNRLKNYLAFVITVYLLLSVGSVYAQTNTTSDSATNSEESVMCVGCIDIQKSFKEQATLDGILSDDENPNVLRSSGNSMMSFATQLSMGIAPQLFSNYDKLEASNASNFTKQGMLGMVDNGTRDLFENQPSTNLYAHFMKEWIPGQGDGAIYAANDGYSFLMGIGIDDLWSKMRTIAYILFVIVLLVAGFMIMFRQKIGGQLAVSIFNALPNVIVGLILVTFSFAIVGLILNISVLLTNVIGALLDPTGQSLAFIDSPWALIWGNANANATRGLITDIATDIGGVAIAGVIIGAIIALASVGTGIGVGLAVAATGPFIFFLFVVAVLGILLYASIRVYITLVVAFLGIIIDTILAPVILAMSSLPGSQDMRGEWFRRILRNALTFPVVFFFVNLGGYILNSGLKIAYPTALTAGDFANVTTQDSLLGMLLKGFLVIGLYFFAADAPKILMDFLPQKDMKGLATAVAGTKAGLQRIPLLGSLFGK